MNSPELVLIGNGDNDPDRFLCMMKYRTPCVELRKHHKKIANMHLSLQVFNWPYLFYMLNAKSNLYLQFYSQKIQLFSMSLTIVCQLISQERKSHRKFLFRQDSLCTVHTHRYTYAKAHHTQRESEV